MNSRTQKTKQMLNQFLAVMFLGCGSMKAICLTLLIGHSGVTSPQMAAVWPSNEVLPTLDVQVNFLRSFKALTRVRFNDVKFSQKPGSFFQMLANGTGMLAIWMRYYSSFFVHVKASTP